MTQVYIKRAYDAPASGDGQRILVDRLWPRGLTHEELDAALWLKEIAPTDALRHWFGHDPEKWDEFRRRYNAELDDNPGPVKELRAQIDAGPVTLLYAAKDEQHNNAVALLAYLDQ